MSSARIFGTDGIRDRAGQGWLVPGRLVAIGRSLGRVLRAHDMLPGAGPHEILIGHDGRQSAAMIRESLAVGLAAADIQSVDLGLCTTPALAWITRHTHHVAGIMISASHNPAEDNGVKFFGVTGEKLPDELEEELEGRLHAEGEDPRGAATTLRADPALLTTYAQHLVRTRFRELRLAGRRIALDCANGGGSGLVPELFRALGAEVHALHSSPDGTNINRGCGALHPEVLAKAVAAQRCELGLCLDGDGDRAILVDERGQVVDGDGILTAMGLGLLQQGRLPGDTVVATVMSNLGLERALERGGARVLRTAVGDRAVVKAMHEGGFELGGEQSGHILFGTEHHHIGDGVFTGLRVLEEMARTGKSLSTLVSAFVRFPQVLVNVKVSHKPPLESLPEVQAAMADAGRELGRDGRLVVRYSGTENLCRVMVEGDTKERIDRLSARIAGAIRASIG
jgi:phosphoglucosamine mutase